MGCGRGYVYSVHNDNIGFGSNMAIGIWLKVYVMKFRIILQSVAGIILLITPVWFLMKIGFGLKDALIAYVLVWFLFALEGWYKRGGV